MKRALLTLPGNEALGQALAEPLGAEIHAGTVHAFPDGESLVRLDDRLEGAHVVTCCTLDRPDSKLVQLAFAARGARDLGAASVGLVAPYLPYLRQDREFHPGEVVSSHHLGWLLSSCFDWVVTVDPHLHRLPDLSHVFSIPAVALHAAPLLAAWVREHVPNAVLIGPDEESAQWVHAVAALAQMPSTILTKTRRGDRDVEVSLPDAAVVAGRTPVLIDDILSTGRTMAETVRHLRVAGLPPPTCLAVHAIFAEGAQQALLDAGAGCIVTCDTVRHPSNGITVAPLLAEAVAGQLVMRAR